MRRPGSVGRLAWLWATLITPGATVRAFYHPPRDLAASRLICLYDTDGRDNGMIAWRECAQCQYGLIAKISLAGHWQRRGIGRLLITGLLQDKPGYTWVTSRQSPDGKEFFTALTAETGIPFAECGQVCQHLRRPAFSGHGRPRRSPRAKVITALSAGCTAAVRDVATLR